MLSSDVDIDLLTHSLLSGQGIRRPTAVEVAYVQERGVLDPIIVRVVKGSIPTNYEILQGVQWWIAAGLVGLSSVPVYIRDDLNDEQAKTLAKSEGQGRVALNPIDEAYALQSLLKANSDWSKADLANHLGKSRSCISHQLRLLELAPPVLMMVKERQLSYGQARPLVTLKPNEQIKFAKHIQAKTLSVRAVESLVSSGRISPRKEIIDEPVKKSSDIVHLEAALSDLLGCTVIIEGGRLIIDYCDNLDVLAGVLERLGWDESCV